MLALRADPCRDEDLSSESDPENEDNANDQNSSVHGNNGGMNSALTTSRRLCQHAVLVNSHVAQYVERIVHLFKGCS